MSHPPVTEVYDSADVVSRYDRLEGLDACEAELFARYVPRGATVLDLGVGAGRTTPVLSSGSSRYVGADLSPAMLERCRERFPSLEFQLLDASDLSRFARGSFDVVVFSFNGVDCITPLDRRAACLRECAQVLRPNGKFIFSVHNASHLIFLPVFEGSGLVRACWRVVYAAAHSAVHLAARLPTGAFWKGSGFVPDPLGDGSPRIFAARPEAVRSELAAVGLRVIEVLPAPYPRNPPKFAVPWYYYVCLKPSGDGARRE